MYTERAKEVGGFKYENKSRNIFIAVILSVVIFLLLALGFWYTFATQSGGHAASKDFEPPKNSTKVLNRIYYTELDPYNMSMLLYGVNEDGKDRRRIYKSSSELSQLRVSPDGNFLIFMKNFDVCMIKHDGKGFKNFGNGHIGTNPYPFSHNGKYVILKIYNKGNIVKLAEIKGKYYEIKKEWKFTNEIILKGFSTDDEGFIYHDQKQGKTFVRNIENDQDMECDYPYRHVSPDGKKKLTISSDLKDEKMRLIHISNLDGFESFELSRYKWGKISYLDIAPRWHRNGMKILIFEKNEEDSQYSNARILELDADRTEVIKESEIVVKGPFNEITW